MEKRILQNIQNIHHHAAIIDYSREEQRILYFSQGDYKKSISRSALHYVVNGKSIHKYVIIPKNINKFLKHYQEIALSGVRTDNTNDTIVDAIRGAILPEEITLAFDIWQTDRIIEDNDMYYTILLKLIDRQRLLGAAKSTADEFLSVIMSNIQKTIKGKLDNIYKIYLIHQGKMNDITLMRGEGFIDSINHGYNFIGRYSSIDLRDTSVVYGAILNNIIDCYITVEVYQ